MVKIIEILWTSNNNLADAQVIKWQVTKNNRKGVVMYDLRDDEVTASNVPSLEDILTIKNAITAIKTSKSKQGVYFTNNPLPTLVSSTTNRNAFNQVTNHLERY